MKKNAILIIVFSLVFGSLATAQQKFQVQNPNWADGEKSTYLVVQGKDTVGISVYQIRKKDYDKTKAYQIEVKLSSEYQGRKNTDNVILLVNQKDLKPLKLERTISVETDTYSFSALYGKEKVKIKAKTPQGEKQTDIDNPQDGYDNEEVIMLLRTLPFKVGYKTTFTDVAVAGLISIPLDVEVVSLDTVTVPAGKFSCYKVKMKFTGREFFAWYQKDKPNLMLQYGEPQMGTQLILKEVTNPETKTGKKY
jgi:hypothetical protein